MGMPRGKVARTGSVRNDPGGGESGRNNYANKDEQCGRFTTYASTVRILCWSARAAFRIICWWRYRLDGQLAGAPHTADLKDFSTIFA